MINEQTLTKRIAIGKFIGLIIGLIGFFVIPLFSSQPCIMLRIGILLWYITFGAIIGIFGTYNHHPIFKFPLPWYIRSTLIGTWLNFVLVFFAYKEMMQIMLEVFGANSSLASPFWFVLEGAILGLIIDFFATKYSNKKVVTKGKPTARRKASKNRKK